MTLKKFIGLTNSNTIITIKANYHDFDGDNSSPVFHGTVDDFLNKRKLDITGYNLNNDEYDILVKCKVVYFGTKLSVCDSSINTELVIEVDGFFKG